MRIGHASWSLIVMSMVSVLAPAARGDTPVMRKEAVDALVQPLLEKGWCNSLVIGVVTDHGRSVAGYGRITDTQPAAPDGKTVFEIGSVSETFTGLLLAQAVEAGDLSLDDPVQKLLPADKVTMPTRGGKPITLRTLTTHTSGLPRLPSNLIIKNPSDPYADYTIDMLYDFLSHDHLPRDPGEKYEYSNLGTGLLGYALALHAGKDYESLLVERVCTPLGMSDTRITLKGSLKARLAQPHNIDGDPSSSWDHTAAFAGAGAIRSTADDMLTYVAAQLALTKTPMDAAIAKSHEPLFTVTPALSIGMNWHIQTADGLIWHNGETGGYHSFVAFMPKARVGVVILCGTATDFVDELGKRVMTMQVAPDRKIAPIKLPAVAKVDPHVLEKYVGKYEMAKNAVITVMDDDGRLYAQLTGQPRYRVFPESDTLFRYRIVDATLEFQRDADGTATALVLHQNGVDHKAPKSN